MKTIEEGKLRKAVFPLKDKKGSSALSRMSTMMPQAPLERSVVTSMFHVTKTHILIMNPTDSYSSCYTWSWIRGKHSL